MNNRDTQQSLEQADIDFLFDQHDANDYGSSDFGSNLASDTYGRKYHGGHRGVPPQTRTGDLIPPGMPKRSSPSLAIVLMSAASGLAGGIFGLYIAYIVLDLSVQISAAVATLSLSAALGITGAGLSALTESRAAAANIALSCGLILLATVVFGFCTLAGALAATLLLTM